LIDDDVNSTCTDCVSNGNKTQDFRRSSFSVNSRQIHMIHGNITTSWKMASNNSHHSSDASAASSCNSHSSSSSCSHHGSGGDFWDSCAATNSLYGDRRLRYDDERTSYDGTNVSYEKPRGADQVWNDIVDLFHNVAKTTRSGLQPSIINHEMLLLNQIKEAIATKYVNEKEFSKGLFAALRQCLESHQLIDECKDSDDEVIVFKHGKTENYAIGIVRAADGTRKPDNGESNYTVNSTLAAEIRLDHCCCLLQRENEDDDEWSVMECLSAAELRLSHQNLCVPFENQENMERSIDLAGGHAALVHVMFYAMDWVLPGLATIGQLEDVVPWAVIVGAKKDTRRKRKTKRVSIESNRWVSGKIVVPQVCAEHFTYKVTGFGRMNDNKSDDDDAIADAVSVYLETILFGLGAAKRFADSPKPVQFVPASGKMVKIGTKELNLTLRSSATMGRSSQNLPNDGNQWSICQGEIFTGRLNIHDIVQADLVERGVLFVFNKEDQEVDVVVKVVSLAVHGYFTQRDSPLRGIERIYENNEGKKTWILRDFPTVALDISNILYAAYRAFNGIIMITADLSKQGYKKLRPQKDNVSLAVLWTAFQELVERVLMPMADLDLVHTELRPGFNLTSNILCKVQGQQATMEIIDYECLVCLHNHNFRQQFDSRYVEPDLTMKWNAMTFLLRQCILVAYAWKEKIPQHVMKHVYLKYMLTDTGRDIVFPAWLEPFRAMAKVKETTRQGLHEALCMMGHLFAES
jgi:hypothetical protein